MIKEDFSAQGGFSSWEQNKKEKNKFEKPERSHEEMAIYTAIEMAVMKRSNLEIKEWVDHYAKDFEPLFNANREQFLKLYKENPEELYVLIKSALEVEDGD